VKSESEAKWSALWCACWSGVSTWWPWTEPRRNIVLLIHQHVLARIASATLAGTSTQKSSLHSRHVHCRLKQLISSLCVRIFDRTIQPRDDRTPRQYHVGATSPPWRRLNAISDDHDAKMTVIASPMLGQPHEVEKAEAPCWEVSRDLANPRRYQKTGYQSPINPLLPSPDLVHRPSS
jgi:hypothetical protein